MISQCFIAPPIFQTQDKKCPTLSGSAPSLVGYLLHRCRTPLSGYYLYPELKLPWLVSARCLPEPCFSTPLNAKICRAISGAACYRNTICIFGVSSWQTLVGYGHHHSCEFICIKFIWSTNNVIKIGIL